MRSDAFSIGACLAGAVVVWLYVAPPVVEPVQDWLADKLKPEPAPAILVVVVGSAANVEVMRRTVGLERILVDTPEAFALDEGRIVAASLDAAGGPVTAAGWADRPLEIVAQVQRRPEVLQAPGGSSSPGGRPHPPLETISHAQALQMLNAIR